MLMSNFVVALIFAVGVGAWVYSKVVRRTGGNATTSIIASVVVAIVVFIIAFTLVGLVAG